MVTWDASNLNKALQERLGAGKRTPKQATDTAAFWVAVNTAKDTPFTPMGKIDTELGVKISGGKNRKYKGTAMGRDVPSVPLARLIILARANLSKMGRMTGQSNYNRLTNNRFALSASDLKGPGAIDSLIHKMIAMRHKSTHFLQSGWVKAKRVLRPLAVNKFRKGEGSPMADSKFDYGTERGFADPATEGWQAQTTIGNLTGLEGINADSHNKALLTYGIEPHQEALDKEARLMKDYTTKQMEADNAKFNARCR